MILQTIKQISCLLCLCCFLQQSAFSQDDKDKPAYTLFDNTGKQISYGESNDSPAMMLSSSGNCTTAPSPIGWNSK